MILFRLNLLSLHSIVTAVILCIASGNKVLSKNPNILVDPGSITTRLLESDADSTLHVLLSINNSTHDPDRLASKLLIRGMKSERTENSSRRELSSISGVRGEGYWTVKGTDYYDANGNKVYFSGVQWSGFETDGCVHGLWVRNYVDMLSQISSLGFNALRLSFAGESLQSWSYPSNIDFNINPDLQGLNSLQVMDKIIEAAKAFNIKVILDYHRIRHTSWPEAGLWYNDEYPESVWLENWAMLAKRYNGNPTVMGVDLFNEVHNSSDKVDYPYWKPGNEGDPYNWRTAAKRAADIIQTHNKGVIIFVEGMWWNSWWSGLFKNVIKYPIDELKVPNKLAYSPHDYGPRVFQQKWFTAKTFPQNMPAYWDKRWGFIVKRNIAPLWLGEWGASFNSTEDPVNTQEMQWVYELRSYIRLHQLSWTWFQWGPDSRDTGGILNDDWQSVRWDKVDFLRYVMYPNFGPSMASLS